MNRRTFFGTLATGAAALSSGRRLATGEAPLPAWRMRLSTSSIQFKDLPIEEVCERIAGLEFEAVDIWSGYENCRHLDDVAGRLGPEGLNALLARNKLKLCSFSTYIGGYARYAELLGNAGGAVAIQGSAGRCAPEELTSKMRAFLESLNSLVDLAEKHDSFLAIENHGDSLLDSLDSFKAFTDLNSSKRLGIALAPYHLQAIQASVPDAIRICGTQLFFFYAWQNAPGLGQLPGHGPADFGPWLEALARSGYGGHVNPFMHGHPEPGEMSAALAKARDYLRRNEGPGRKKTNRGESLAS